MLLSRECAIFSLADSCGRGNGGWRLAGEIRGSGLKEETVISLLIVIILVLVIIKLL